MRGKCHGHVQGAQVHDSTKRLQHTWRRADTHYVDKEALCDGDI